MDDQPEAYEVVLRDVQPQTEEQVAAIWQAIVDYTDGGDLTA